MNHPLRCIAKALFLLLAILALGAVVMQLWNWVLPTLFSAARAIDYAHALGLLLLCRILFGGFRGHGGWHARHHWRKWEAMTQEEREQLRDSWQAKHRH